MAQLSAILAGFLPGILLNYFGKDNAISFFYASLVFSILCSFALCMVYLFTWERPNELKSKEALLAEQLAASLPFKESIRHLVIELLSTFKIKIFRQHLGMYLGGYIAQDVFNAVFTYYVIFVLLQEPTVASMLIGTMSITQFVAVLCMMPLCIKYGPAPAYRAVVTIFGISCLSYGVIWYYNLSHVHTLLVTISAIAGLGRGGINYVPWNIYTYISDVDEIITGKRREGIFAGVMTFTRKASQAGAVMLIGVCLQWSGFVSGQNQQPEQVSLTILFLLVIGTIFVLSLGFLISLKFKLNLTTHKILINEINNIKGIGSSSEKRISDEGKPVVEMLTGMPVSQLWGNNNIGYKNKFVFND